MQAGAESFFCQREMVAVGNGSPWLQDPLHAAERVRRVDLTSLERVEVRKRFLDVTTGQTLFDSRAETPRALSPGRRLT